MRKRCKANAGISNIWVVLLLPVLVAFTGLAVDIGYMAWVAQQLQIGADAGALAGVQRLRTGDQEGTRDLAQLTTGANTAAAAPIQLDWNGANSAEGDIVIGRFDRTEGEFVATINNPNAVQVTARRTGDSLNGSLPLLFGPAFGFAETNMSRTAIAMFGGGTGSGLLVLGDEEHAFHIKGSATLQVNGGDIQVNSSHHHAAYFQGSGYDINPDASDAGSVNIVGDYRTTGNPELPPINTDAEPQEDPIRAMLEAYNDPAALSPYAYYGDTLVTRALADYPAVNGVRGLEPGFYPAGIAATGDTLDLAPGIYAVDGAGLDIRGNTNLIADGVLFYIMGQGSLYLGGTGDVRMTPIEDTIYDGISVFQAYDNTNPATIIGNGSMDLEGAFYFPDNHLTVSGDSITLGNQLITNTILIDGNGTITISYEGQQQGVGAQTFLVR